jgi:hypothetical protein
MTDQAPFIRYQASHHIHVVGTFKNEHGERFVIYRNEGGDKPFITGDEYDWEPKIPLLWNSFTFSTEEREEIAKILWPTFEETAKKAQAMTDQSEPGDTPESIMRQNKQAEESVRQQEYGIVYGDPAATPNNP